MAWPHSFEPNNGGVVVSVGTTSSTPAKLTDDVGEIDVRIHNDSTTTTFFAVGGNNVAASTSGPLSLAANSVEVFRFRTPSFSGQGLYIAVIAAAAGGTVRCTPGVGL